MDQGYLTMAGPEADCISISFASQLLHRHDPHPQKALTAAGN
jgi:hypothetical protein